MTYDENGFYGHPDHIQANRVTRAAMAECGIPAKLYYTAMARSRLRGFRDVLAQAGIEVPAEVQENPDFGTPDELITTTIDCSAVAGAQVRLARRPRQPERQHLLLADGGGAVLDHHGIGELRPGPRLDRRAGPRRRPLRRAALSRRARAGPAPHREKGTRARSGVVPTSRCRPGRSRRERGEPIRRGTSAAASDQQSPRRGPRP